MGAITLPYASESSFGSISELSGADFFRFEAVLGTTLRVDLEGQSTGVGTLGDSFLGLFDSHCVLLASDDDGGAGLNSRIVFSVPEDGIFIIAATAYPDFEFLGGGAGTYRLAISPFAALNSISGQVVDAGTGESLPGGVSPFAFVTLLRCEEEENCFWINSQSTDDQGYFWFQADDRGQPLEPGIYQIHVYAEEYQSSQTDFYSMGEEEDRAISNISLRPFPIQFSEIQPCQDLPPQGGICRYSVRITNRSGNNLRGAVWSLVDSDGIGSLSDFTRFQTAEHQSMALAPGASSIARFAFTVPATVRDNSAHICTGVFFGQGSRNPYFSTVGQKHLFCISKGADGFSAVPEEESQKWSHRQEQENRNSRRQLHRRSRKSPRRGR